jgi:hypothetical protein
MSFETEIRELTGQYWDIAFHEGKSGKSNGDLAGKILHNIEEAVSRMQAEVEALKAPITADDVTDEMLKKYDELCYDEASTPQQHLAAVLNLGVKK